MIWSSKPSGAGAGAGVGAALGAGAAAAGSAAGVAAAGVAAAGVASAGAWPASGQTHLPRRHVLHAGIVLLLSVWLWLCVVLGGSVCFGGAVESGRHATEERQEGSPGGGGGGGGGKTGNTGEPSTISARFRVSIAPAWLLGLP